MWHRYAHTTLAKLKSVRLFADVPTTDAQLKCEEWRRINQGADRMTFTRQPTPYQVEEALLFEVARGVQVRVAICTYLPHALCLSATYDRLPHTCLYAIYDLPL